MQNPPYKLPQLVTIRFRIRSIPLHYVGMLNPNDVIHIKSLSNMISVFNSNNSCYLWFIQVYFVVHLASFRWL
jgi:hypothetical protein